MKEKNKNINVLLAVISGEKNKMLNGLYLYYYIRRNIELNHALLEGFIKGTKNQKIYDIPIHKIVAHLNQHQIKFRDAFIKNNVEKMKENLADMISIEGIIFLKLNGDLK